MSVLKLIHVSVVVFVVTGCSAASTRLYETVKASDIKLGVEQTYVRNALGKPKKQGSVGSFEYYNYCVFGFQDEMYEFVFADGLLVWKDRYLNSEGGACEKFFRPINFAKIKALIEAKQAAKFDKTVYNIDTLRITTVTRKQTDYCISGNITEILLEGIISPDSSFAMSRLLQKLQPCRDEADRIIRPVTISLQSGGGLLADGFRMGETFREFSVSTLIEDDSICASSCAVAFLGGSERIIEEDGKIMFHAPYFSGRNEYGERDVDCRVGDKTYEELLAFYIAMTSKDVGERLFERTLWYCSADDGWLVTGGAAAELYGIATQK